MNDVFDNLAEAFQPAPSPGPGRTPGPVGMAVLMILWAALGLAPFVFAVEDLKLATGRTGSPGTLTVVSCAPLGQGRYDCRGSFVLDRTGETVQVAASPDSTVGDVRRARLTPEGDRAVPAGTSGVLAALTLPFLGVGVLGFLPYALLYVLRVRRGRRPAVAVGCLLTAVSLAGLVVGVVAAYS
ncbi:hypothetical protein [Streptosporangium sp. NPDC000239]|uniref:Uncharacterized protein n=1 Tax=Streptosporangium jomthongense TaxID=1193683 RepID=A0ABV8EYE0_9ACTN